MPETKSPAEAKHGQQTLPVATHGSSSSGSSRIRVLLSVGLLCLAGVNSPPKLDVPATTRQLAGLAGLQTVLKESGADLVVNAITGAAGLRSSVRALELGLELAIANKESLVMAGSLLLALAAERGGRIVPIDSEHSAILQCLRAGDRGEVQRIVLTASGGPFRGRTRNELSAVTVEEALRHPTWKMGPKITIDSATLMNKALEVIEAHVLFDLDPARIDVVIHPESVVHSLVEFQDGSTMAQLGPPDMRIPIQYALSHPDRWPRPDAECPLLAAGALHFEAPDHEVFPSIQMAYEVCRHGGTMPAVFNASNEVAVARFMEGRVPFPGIFDLVSRALDAHNAQPVTSLEQVLEVDRRVRRTLND